MERHVSRGARVGYLTLSLNLVGCWLCLTSHRQWGHLDTAPPFTVPCEGREAWFLHHSHRDREPTPGRRVPVHYTTAAPRELHNFLTYNCTCIWINRGTFIERPPWREATPSGKATWQCKSKHKCIDFYPLREATPLDRQFFWHKRGGLTRGVPLNFKVKLIYDVTFSTAK